jgi:hypothetical protein
MHQFSSSMNTSVLLFLVTFYGQIMVMMVCAMLGGAGINTQPSFQATKGIHGST